jgi:hypothetical protein
LLAEPWGWAGGFSTGGSGGWTANYTWTLQVDPTTVPEPASLLVFASGLAAVGLRRYQRREGESVE